MPAVREYMSARLVYVAEGSRPRVALQPMLELGVDTVPVLDDSHRPIGVVSMRDLIESHDHPKITTPVKTILDTATIDEAAREMVDANIHHLIVVDAKGQAVGMLSSLDIVRASIGAKPKHPSRLEKI